MRWYALPTNISLTFRFDCTVRVMINALVFVSITKMLWGSSFTISVSAQSQEEMHFITVSDETPAGRRKVLYHHKPERNLFFMMAQKILYRASKHSLTFIVLSLAAFWIQIKHPVITEGYFSQASVTGFHISTAEH